MQQATFICTIALLVLSAAAQQDYDYESSQPSRPARLQSSGFSGNAGPKPTPIAILKQINRHNEDGSYTYGYEGGDGSFKIETKLPGGEVKGKYGYVDNVTGKLRVVEYGANRYGFQPAGEGITVAPPTLVDETTNKDGTLNSEYADLGQYYEQQPAAQDIRPAPRPKVQPQQQFDFNSAPRYAPPPQAPIRQASPAPPRPQIPGAQPAPVEIDYTSPPRFAAARPAPAPVHTFSPAPRPAPQRLQYAAPAPVEEDITYAEPAPRPAPRPAQIPTRFAPAPQPAFRPQPQYAPAPGPRPAPNQGGRAGGVLDQLARDYALPQGGSAPLHDISFGYY